jgi:hypothetical protein
LEGRIGYDYVNRKTKAHRIRITGESEGKGKDIVQYGATITITEM